MADYQFHSADCPLWHPEKYVAGGADASTSKCWCQRWSNLVDWNVSGSDVASGDASAVLGVKKDAYGELKFWNFSILSPTTQLRPR